MSGVNEIRSAFLNYFAAEGHEIVPSSPLVPRNDPTLMFTMPALVNIKVGSLRGTSGDEATIS